MDEPTILTALISAVLGGGIWKFLEKKLILNKALAKIDYETEDVKDIVTKIEFAIEQHSSFLKVISPEEYAKQEEELNKKREFWNL